MNSSVPQIAEGIFFNHAAIAPIPPLVAQAAVDTLNALATGAPDINSWVLAMEKSRTKVASLIGCESTSIGFMQNTSQAISTVAQGLDWEEGDEILIPSIEYPANQYPWLSLESRGVHVKRISPDSGNITVEWLQKHCTKKTKLVAFSQIQFSNGYAAPVKEIATYCREHNILTLVDAIQAFGAFTVDVSDWNVDFCAFGSQKWLMAPPGISVLYVRPDKIRSLTPIITGAFSVKNPFDVQTIELDFPDATKKIESGTMNFTLFPAFLKALELFEKEGSKKISQEIRLRSSFLTKALLEKSYEVVSPTGESEMSGIVVCAGKAEKIETLYKKLCANKITVTHRDKSIRFSPHFYNSFDELKEVVKLL